MRRIIYILCLLNMAAFAQPLFSPHDRQHAAKALDALAMIPEDVKFTKDHGEPEWALSWVTNALNDPYMLPEVADRIYQASEENNNDSIWSLAAELIEIGEAEDWGTYSKTVSTLKCPEKIDRELLDALNWFYGRALRAAVSLDRAFSSVDQNAKEYLASSVLSSVFNTELNIENRMVLTNAGIPRAVQERVELESDLLDSTDVSIEWLEQVKGVDLQQVHEAAQRLHKGTAELLDKLSTVTNWPSKPVTIETELGCIVVGSMENDSYSSQSFLILDPDGNDEYRDDAGVANGLLDQPISVVMDLAGNDRYLGKGLLAPGSSLFGISTIMDGAGDDHHESDYVGIAAAIYGAAWVEDFEGNDIYRAQAICQGAGITGFGTMIDHEGNDHYQAGLYGQGFAGVKGWGMLLDRKGNDVYIAGNVRKDSDRNEDRYLSLSQGFSIGARPHAGGGVAALIDLEGNDTYTADVYGQGVSYYYSAGFLIDIKGNDRYSMYQYGQGCGIHFSLGLLADTDGNDLYSGFILAQGAAHDYSVGMLFDHAGNDTYTADHHAQGRALNNAFAMLVDRDGDDGYFGRQRDGAQGIGNEGGYRDYGSLALLLDLSGRDVYSGGFSNRVITLRPLYGVVYDFEKETTDEK